MKCSLMMQKQLQQVKYKLSSVMVQLSVVIWGNSGSAIITYWAPPWILETEYTDRSVLLLYFSFHRHLNKALWGVIKEPQLDVTNCHCCTETCLLMATWRRNARLGWGVGKGDDPARVVRKAVRIAHGGLKHTGKSSTLARSEASRP